MHSLARALDGFSPRQVGYEGASVKENQRHWTDGRGELTPHPLG